MTHKIKELLFLVEEDNEGGYQAKTLGHAIFTQSDTYENIKEEIKDAVRCYFNEREIPSIIKLRFGKDEVILV